MILSFICLMGMYSSAVADPMIMSSYKHLVGSRESFHKKGALFDKGQTHNDQYHHHKQQHQNHFNGRNLNNLRGNIQPKEQKKGHEIYSRRIPGSRPIDYGGEHPYELMEQHRRRASRTRRRGSTTNYESYWYESTFSLDDYIQDESYDVDDDFDPAAGDSQTKFEPSEEEVFNLDAYKPIRIRIYSDFLMEFFQEDMKKNEFIIYHVLPPAIQFWAKTLKVFPTKRLFLEGCGIGPPSDAVYGRNDADMVLYVSANRSCSGTDSQGYETKAGAQSCDWDQYDRPIGGVIDFCYEVFELDENGRATDKLMKDMIEIAIHEIGHILGLTSDDMAFFYDRTTGLPRTKRPLKPAQNIECVDGRKASDFDSEIYAPSTDTLAFGAMYPGIKYFEVVTPTVRQVAQNHFNCKEMRGMRLENQPTSNDCFGDHWEERLAYDAQMSSVLTKEPIPSFLSPFTLALLEDTGWYIANYTMSRVTSFGHGIGCDFVQKPCIGENDALPEYSIGSFCNTTDRNVYSCDPTHRMIATCDLYDLSKVPNQEFPPIPQVFRQFDNPALGPKTLQQADFCPMFSEQFIDCSSPPPTFLVKSKMFLEEEYYGTESRCFNSNFPKPLCLKSYCDEELAVIWVKIGDYEVKCESDDQRVEVELGGEMYYIECPKKAVLCPDMFCPADCEGKEVCNWDLPTPKCEASYKGISTMVGFQNTTGGEVKPPIDLSGGSNEFLPLLQPVNGTDEDVDLPVDFTKNSTVDSSLFLEDNDDESGVELNGNSTEYLPTNGTSLYKEEEDNDDESGDELSGNSTEYLPTNGTSLSKEEEEEDNDDESGVELNGNSTEYLPTNGTSLSKEEEEDNDDESGVELSGNSTEYLPTNGTSEGDDDGDDDGDDGNFGSLVGGEIPTNQTEFTGTDNIVDEIIGGFLGSNQTNATIIDDSTGDGQTNETGFIDKYDFHSGYDSVGYELIRLTDQLSLAQVAEVCENLIFCAGFNDVGWLKYKIKTEDEWTISNSNNGEIAGLYIKKNTEKLMEPYLDDEVMLEEYNFYPQTDSLDGNLFRSEGGDNVNAAICSINPICIGFSSEGWIKHEVKSQSEWVENYSSKSEGLYVKKNVLLDNEQEEKQTFYPSQSSISLSPSLAVDMENAPSIAPSSSSSTLPGTLSTSSPSSSSSEKPSLSTSAVDASPSPSVTTTEFQSAMPSVEPEGNPPSTNGTDKVNGPVAVKGSNSTNATTGDDPKSSAYSKGKATTWAVAVVLVIGFL